MVEADTTDCIETPQVVLVVVIKAMPSNDVKWRVRLGRAKHCAVELGDDIPLRGGIFVKGCGGRCKVSRIGETIRSDRPKLRQ